MGTQCVIGVEKASPALVVRMHGSVLTKGLYRAVYLLNKLSADTGGGISVLSVAVAFRGSEPILFPGTRAAHELLMARFQLNLANHLRLSH